MLESIKEDEIEFMEDFHNPIALSECLFHNFDILGSFDEKELGHIRNGQLPLVSYEYLLDDNPQLSKKENFKLREGAGTIYCLGGRKFGKTLIVEIIDILISLILNDGDWAGLASLDAIHVRGVIEKVIVALDRHPFYRIFDVHINRSPNFRIEARNGYLLESVNMNLFSRNAGAQFFQKHFTRLFLEEASFETDTVYKQRQDSVSEDGCVIRAAGMTNFTKYSPIGRIFYDYEKKGFVCNLPQYVNPKWDEKEKEKALKEHGGGSTASFRMFVKGEVVEEGVSEIDMERVRKFYDEERMVKHFEINKINFLDFKNIIILDKPKQTVRCWVDADIGETAPTEIIILFEFADKFHYEYKITLYNLTDKEQFQIFDYIVELLEPNFIGLDVTEGTGRSIFRRLEEKYGREHLVWCAFNAKLVVDFERDDRNNVIFKNGKPVEKEEYVNEWSIKVLKELLYEGKFDLPIDYQLDVQLNSVISTLSGNRRIYECASEEDHLFSAFKVFAISYFLNQFNASRPLMKKTFSKISVGE